MKRSVVFFWAVMLQVATADFCTSGTANFCSLPTADESANNGCIFAGTPPSTSSIEYTAKYTSPSSVINPANHYVPGEELELTIQSPTAAIIVGFQMYCVSNPVSPFGTANAATVTLGTFSNLPTGVVPVANCGGDKFIRSTDQFGVPKSSVTVTWTAPSLATADALTADGSIVCNAIVWVSTNGGLVFGDDGSTGNGFIQINLAQGSSHAACSTAGRVFCARQGSEATPGVNTVNPCGSGTTCGTCQGISPTYMVNSQEDDTTTPNTYAGTCITPNPPLCATYDGGRAFCDRASGDVCVTSCLQCVDWASSVVLPGIEQLPSGFKQCTATPEDSDDCGESTATANKLLFCDPAEESPWCVFKTPACESSDCSSCNADCFQVSCAVNGADCVRPITTCPADCFATKATSCITCNSTTALEGTVCTLATPQGCAAQVENSIVTTFCPNNETVVGFSAYGPGQGTCVEDCGDCAGFPTHVGSVGNGLSACISTPHLECVDDGTDAASRLAYCPDGVGTSCDPIADTLECAACTNFREPDMTLGIASLAESANTLAVGAPLCAMPSPQVCASQGGDRILCIPSAGLSKCVVKANCVSASCSTSAVIISEGGEDVCLVPSPKNCAARGQLYCLGANASTGTCVTSCSACLGKTFPANVELGDTDGYDITDGSPGVGSVTTSRILSRYIYRAEDTIGIDDNDVHYAACIEPTDLDCVDMTRRHAVEHFMCRATTTTSSTFNKCVTNCNECGDADTAITAVIRPSLTNLVGDPPLPYVAGFDNDVVGTHYTPFLLCIEPDANSCTTWQLGRANTVFLYPATVASDTTLPTIVGDVVEIWNRTSNAGTLQFPAQRWSLSFGGSGCDTTLPPVVVGPTFTSNTELCEGSTGASWTDGLDEVSMDSIANSPVGERALNITDISTECSLNYCPAGSGSCVFTPADGGAITSTTGFAAHMCSTCGGTGEGEYYQDITEAQFAQIGNGGEELDNLVVTLLRRVCARPTSGTCDDILGGYCSSTGVLQPLFFCEGAENTCVEDCTDGTSCGSATFEDSTNFRCLSPDVDNCAPQMFCPDASPLIGEQPSCIEAWATNHFTCRDNCVGAPNLVIRSQESVLTRSCFAPDVGLCSQVEFEDNTIVSNEIVRPAGAPLHHFYCPSTSYPLFGEAEDQVVASNPPGKATVQGNVYPNGRCVAACFGVDTFQPFVPTNDVCPQPFKIARPGVCTRPSSENCPDLSFITTGTALASTDEDYYCNRRDATGDGVTSEEGDEGAEYITFEQLCEDVSVAADTSGNCSCVLPGQCRNGECGVMVYPADLGNGRRRCIDPNPHTCWAFQVVRVDSANPTPIGFSVGGKVLPEKFFCEIDGVQDCVDDCTTDCGNRTQVRSNFDGHDGRMCFDATPENCRTASQAYCPPYLTNPAKCVPLVWPNAHPADDLDNNTLAVYARCGADCYGSGVVSSVSGDEWTCILPGPTDAASEGGISDTVFPTNWFSTSSTGPSSDACGKQLVTANEMWDATIGAYTLIASPSVVTWAQCIRQNTASPTTTDAHFESRCVENCANNECVNTGASSASNIFLNLPNKRYKQMYTSSGSTFAACIPTNPNSCAHGAFTNIAGDSLGFAHCAQGQVQTCVSSCIKCIGATGATNSTDPVTEVLCVAATDATVCDNNRFILANSAQQAFYCAGPLAGSTTDDECVEDCEEDCEEGGKKITRPSGDCAAPSTEVCAEIAQPSFYCAEEEECVASCANECGSAVVVTLAGCQDPSESSCANARDAATNDPLTRFYCEGEDECVASCNNDCPGATAPATQTGVAACVPADALTCAGAGQVFCPPLSQCVASCTQCPDNPHVLTTGNVAQCAPPGGRACAQNGLWFCKNPIVDPNVAVRQLGPPACIATCSITTCFDHLLGTPAVSSSDPQECQEPTDCNGLNTGITDEALKFYLCSSESSTLEVGGEPFGFCTTSCSNECLNAGEEWTALRDVVDWSPREFLCLEPSAENCRKVVAATTDELFVEYDTKAFCPASETCIEPDQCASACGSNFPVLNRNQRTCILPSETTCPTAGVILTSPTARTARADGELLVGTLGQGPSAFDIDYAFFCEPDEVCVRRCSRTNSTNDCGKEGGDFRGTNDVISGLCRKATPSVCQSIPAAAWLNNPNGVNLDNAPRQVFCGSTQQNDETADPVESLVAALDGLQAECVDSCALTSTADTVAGHCRVFQDGFDARVDDNLVATETQRRFICPRWCSSTVQTTCTNDADVTCANTAAIPADVNRLRLQFDGRVRLQTCVFPTPVNCFNTDIIFSTQDIANAYQLPPPAGSSPAENYNVLSYCPTIAAPTDFTPSSGQFPPGGICVQDCSLNGQIQWGGSFNPLTGELDFTNGDLSSIVRVNGFTVPVSGPCFRIAADHALRLDGATFDDLDTPTSRRCAVPTGDTCHLNNQREHCTSEASRCLPPDDCSDCTPDQLQHSPQHTCFAPDAISCEDEDTGDGQAFCSLSIAHEPSGTAFPQCVTKGHCYDSCLAAASTQEFTGFQPSSLGQPRGAGNCVAATQVSCRASTESTDPPTQVFYCVVSGRTFGASCVESCLTCPNRTGVEEDQPNRFKSCAPANPTTCRTAGLMYCEHLDQCVAAQDGCLSCTGPTNRLAPQFGATENECVVASGTVCAALDKTYCPPSEKCIVRGTCNTDTTVNGTLVPLCLHYDVNVGVAADICVQSSPDACNDEARNEEFCPEVGEDGLPRVDETGATLGSCIPDGSTATGGNPDTCKDNCPSFPTFIPTEGVCSRVTGPACNANGEVMCPGPDSTQPEVGATCVDSCDQCVRVEEGVTRTYNFTDDRDGQHACYVPSAQGCSTSAFEEALPVFWCESISSCSLDCADCAANDFGAVNPESGRNTCIDPSPETCAENKYLAFCSLFSPPACVRDSCSTCEDAAISAVISVNNECVVPNGANCKNNDAGTTFFCRLGTERCLTDCSNSADRCRNAADGDDRFFDLVGAEGNACIAPSSAACDDKVFCQLSVSDSRLLSEGGKTGTDPPGCVDTPADCGQCERDGTTPEHGYSATNDECTEASRRSCAAASSTLFYCEADTTCVTANQCGAACGGTVAVSGTNDAGQAASQCVTPGSDSCRPFNIAFCEPTGACVASCSTCSDGSSTLGYEAKNSNNAQCIIPSVADCQEILGLSAVYCVGDTQGDDSCAATCSGACGTSTVQASTCVAPSAASCGRLSRNYCAGSNAGITGVTTDSCVVDCATSCGNAVGVVANACRVPQDTGAAPLGCLPNKYCDPQLGANTAGEHCSTSTSCAGCNFAAGTSTFQLNSNTCTVASPANCAANGNQFFCPSTNSCVASCSTPACPDGTAGGTVVRECFTPSGADCFTNNGQAFCSGQCVAASCDSCGAGSFMSRVAATLGNCVATPALACGTQFFCESTNNCVTSCATSCSTASFGSTNSALTTTAQSCIVPGAGATTGCASAGAFFCSGTSNCVFPTCAGCSSGSVTPPAGGDTTCQSSCNDPNPSKQRVHLQASGGGRLDVGFIYAVFTDGPCSQTQLRDATQATRVFTRFATFDREQFQQNILAQLVTQGCNSPNVGKVAFIDSMHMDSNPGKPVSGIGSTTAVDTSPYAHFIVLWDRPIYTDELYFWTSTATNWCASGNLRSQIPDLPSTAFAEHRTAALSKMRLLQATDPTPGDVEIEPSTGTPTTLDATTSTLSCRPSVIANGDTVTCTVSARNSNGEAVEVDPATISFCTGTTDLTASAGNEHVSAAGVLSSSIVATFTTLTNGQVITARTGGCTGTAVLNTYAISIVVPGVCGASPPGGLCAPGLANINNACGCVCPSHTCSGSTCSSQTAGTCPATITCFGGTITTNCAGANSVTASPTNNNLPDDFTYVSSSGGITFNSDNFLGSNVGFVSTQALVSGTSRIGSTMNLYLCNAGFSVSGTFNVNNDLTIVTGTPSGACSVAGATQSFTVNQAATVNVPAGLVVGPPTTNNGAIAVSGGGTVSFRRGFNNQGTFTCGTSIANDQGSCTFSGAISIAAASTFNGVNEAGFTGTGTTVTVASGDASRRTAPARFLSGTSLSGSGPFGGAVTFTSGSTLIYSCGTPLTFPGSLTLLTGATVQIEQANENCPPISAPAGGVQPNVNIVINSIAGNTTLTEGMQLPLFTTAFLGATNPADLPVSFSANSGQQTSASPALTTNGNNVVIGVSLGSGAGVPTGGATTTPPTAPAATTPQIPSSTGGGDDGISSGAIAGILVGAIGGLCCCLIIVGIILFMLSKSRRGSSKQPVVYDNDGNVIFQQGMDTPASTPTYGMY